MIVTCTTCHLEYDDLYRYTFCPHPGFQMRCTVVRGDGRVKVCSTVTEVNAFIREGDPRDTQRGERSPAKRTGEQGRSLGVSNEEFYLGADGVHVRRDPAGQVGPEQPRHSSEAGHRDQGIGSPALDAPRRGQDDAPGPPIDYAAAPGLWNAVRWWIRRRVRFSTYQLWIAPLIGWPQVKAHVRPSS